MDGKDICYEFVPGPFLDILFKAHKDEDNDYVLAIEEINRADAAAVFGDMFQLLDRNSDGESTYSVNISKDIKYWWEKEALESKAPSKLSIPKNMYIWATMNSADQGVFPLDTAFKRRWSFKYMPLNNAKSEIANTKVTIVGDNNSENEYLWDDIRKKINSYLGLKHVNEDKMLGQFFLSKEELENDNFANAFKDKVLMYLYEDAARIYRSDLFSKNGFSEICNEFDKNGLSCFKNDAINVDPVIHTTIAENRR